MRNKNKKQPTKSKDSEETASYDILRVDWEDHWTGNATWQTVDKLETKPLHCVSVGVKVVETKDTLVLAQNLGVNRLVSDTMVILKKCILKKTNLGTITYGKET